MLRTLPLWLALVALGLGGCRAEIEDDDGPPIIVDETRYVDDDPDTTIIEGDDDTTIIEGDEPDTDVDVEIEDEPDTDVDVDVDR